MADAQRDGFTAHNIRLDDGSVTIPTDAKTIDELPVLQAAVRILNLVLAGRPAGHSIVDLGCLEGGFALEFARLGMLSTGIEVRESNLRHCRHAKSKVDLPNLDFIQDDVTRIRRHGPYDVIFASGLLYHLEHPRAFLQDAAAVCRRAIILYTHVATREETPSRAYHGLSEVAEHEGLSGRWYTERPQADLSDAELEKLRWHSWRNVRSFWPEKNALLATLQACGFATVLEVFDWLGPLGPELAHGVYTDRDRVMLVGIR